MPLEPHRDRKGVNVVMRTGLEYKMNVHNNCVCNEFRALTERHLIDKGARPEEGVLVEALEMMRPWLKDKLVPLGYMEVVNGYRGAKKRRYYSAYLWLRDKGYTKKHDRIRMFVKKERFSDADVKVKPPRAIQYRTPEFTLRAMRYVRKFEDHYYKELVMGVASGTRVVAKGLNWEERAQLVVEKASYFRTPKFVLIDYSAFDSTQTESHLRAVHKMYSWVFGKGVKRLFKAQLFNKCRTQHGIKYEVRGTGMSGDPDTALKNTLLNVMCLQWLVKQAGVVKYDMLVDGDDSILILEESIDVTAVERFGFIPKVEVVDNIHKVEFCQSRIIFRPKPLFVRNPRKVLAACCICLRDFKGRWRDWLASVGQCERAVNAGVPVLSILGRVLDELSEKKIQDRDLERRMAGMEVKDQPITDVARCTFAEAWGIPPGIQQVLEQHLTSDCIWVASNYENLQNVESLSRQRTWYECGDESGGSCWWCGS